MPCQLRELHSDMLVLDDAPTMLVLITSLPSEYSMSDDMVGINGGCSAMIICVFANMLNYKRLTTRNICEMSWVYSDLKINKIF